jgi:hypothetical protein
VSQDRHDLSSCDGLGRTGRQDGLEVAAEFAERCTQQAVIGGCFAPRGNRGRRVEAGDGPSLTDALAAFK